MLPFMKSDIGTVRQRIRKPAITAGLFFGVLLLDVIFRQHRLGYFLTHELLGPIVTSFMIGGLWYGKRVMAEVGRAPIDEETGEELHPGGFNGTAMRLAVAMLVGATVGAVFFAIDTIRLICGMVKK